MTNAELIKALRKCGKQSPDRCWDCEYYDREPWCESALANDAADALEADDKRIAELEAQEPTEKQVVDYCRKRCLVIASGELFQKMKATFSRLPKEGEWIEQDDGNSIYHKCSVCGKNQYNVLLEVMQGDYHYCPNCGAKMKGERNDHQRM